MAQANMVAGTWRGRLIDIRGYEGEVSLRLDGDERRFKGVATVSIGGTHASQTHRIELVGELRDDRLVLSGTVPGDVGVEFGIEAAVFELPVGGMGLRGTYEVATKTWSALRAGVITASSGMRPPSTEIEDRTPRAEVAS